ncbi:MAG: AAA family ATPase, partial [Lentisphaerae bacterium]|nr:AAA family ATPase [Lentisphaerota bacterium]
MAKLFITEGNNTGMEVDVPPKGLVIGRREECDLTISDDLASGRHAKVEQQDGQWVIVDLGSTNGTLMNNQRISAMSLADGDNFKIGNTTIVFKLNGSATAEAVAVVSEPGAAPESAPAPKPSAVKAKARPKAPPPAAAPSAGAEANLQASPDDLKLVEQMSQNAEAIRRETAKLIIGQREVLDQILMCMIAGGHALLVGMPGLAKTTIVSTIAKVLDLEFKRVQFTPDLMPADITGTEILETNKSTNEKEFRFIKGPIFCNLLLADEINRTPPKTQ